MLGEFEREVAAFNAVNAATPGGASTTGAIGDAAALEPVVKIVNMLLTEAARTRTSDVHIECKEDTIRVRFRVDGALRDVVTLPGAMASSVSNRIKIMSKMNIAERRRPQDGQMSLTIDGRLIEVRVTSAAMNVGEKLVLRLADKSGPLRLEQLGMNDAMLAVYRDLLQAPFGMLVCAGPTGSGKTTTMFATISEMNRPDLNVTTIEDPVEFVDPALNQMSVNVKAGLTFESCLRSILRQDPDIILVGEIRDRETANLAVQATLSGHFVLSTVHATDAPSVLFRFVEMGIDRYLITSTLLGVIGQRLVRRMCTNCVVEYQPTEAELQYYLGAGGRTKGYFVRGAGCPMCQHTGYFGRVGMFELMLLTGPMKDLMLQPDVSLARIRTMAREQGMIPLASAGIGLVEEDQTTIMEVARTTYSVVE